MRRSLAALVMLFVSASAAHGDDAPPPRPETEIIAASIPPYVYEETPGSGKSAGVMSELIAAMAKRIGHSGKITYLPWARAQQVTRESKDGMPRLLLPLTRTQAREYQYKWVVSLLEDDAVLVTHKGKQPLITDVEAAKGLSTGALLGSPQEAFLRDQRFTKIEAGVDEETNARKLNAGRLQIWFVARMVAPFLYQKAGLDPTNLQYGVKLRTNDLYLGASPALPDSEAERWRDALRAIQEDGTYDKIVNAYR